MRIKNRRIVGIMFITLAILFINIIPDPSDILTLQVYSAFTGADVSPSNLSVVYLDFIGWSLMVGGLLLLAGAFLLGWSPKKLFKKLNLGKYKIFIGLSTISVVVVSIFNIRYPYLFFLIAPSLYWIFFHKDKSEWVGIYGSSAILYLSGLGTLVSYIVARTPIPETLSHLNNHIFLGWLSSTLGFAQVNNLVLCIGIFIGFLLVCLYSKVLKEFL